MFDWLSLILANKSPVVYGKMLILCYYIWFYSNQLTWKQKRWQPGKVVAHALSFYDQWVVSNTPPPVSQAQEGISNTCWTKPPCNVLKVNVDASWADSSRVAGVRAVMQNSEGIMIAGLLLSLSYVDCAMMAEACALRETLSWLQSYPLDSVVIELDAQVIVKALYSPVDMLSSFGVVIDDCKSLLSNLSRVQVVFVSRSTNSVAHELAKITGSMINRVE